MANRIKVYNGSGFIEVDASTIGGHSPSEFAKKSHTHDFGTDITNKGEAFLTWGGKNYAGDYGPIDAAMVPALGANRLAFAHADGIEVEYSRDAGATWTDYGLANYHKSAIFSGPQTSYGIVIGKPGSKNTSTGKYDNASVNNRVRVTITSNTAGIYTVLNKFVIYCSTNGSGGCKCTIDCKTKANYDAGNDTWITFANGIDISGWSGFNVVNTSRITTYANNSAQYLKLRFTFYCTSEGSMATSGGLTIYNIYGFGGVGWLTPSNMAKWGQIYSYDAYQNAYFPAGITSGTIYSYNIYPRANNTYNLGSNTVKWGQVHATTIYENGTALSSKYAANTIATSTTLGLVKSSTTGTTANRDYNVQVNSDGTMKVNVPWTDNNTTYSPATTTANGLMTSTDKSKLDGIASGATKVTTDTVSGWGYTKNAGTVTGVKVGSTSYSPSSGVVSLPAYPTSMAWNSITGKPSSYTPASHNQASNTITAMTGYSKPSSTSAIATSDSLNAAIGKLEKALDSKGTSNLTIGNTSTTAAAGNHTHDYSSTYAAKSHTHDDRYYTETEVDNKLSGKSDTGHTHSVATTSANGFMSSAMVTQLNQATSDLSTLSQTVDTLDSDVSAVEGEITNIKNNYEKKKTTKTIFDTLTSLGTNATQVGVFTTKSITLTDSVQAGDKLKVYLCGNSYYEQYCAGIIEFELFNPSTSSDRNMVSGAGMIMPTIGEQKFIVSASVQNTMSTTTSLSIVVYTLSATNGAPAGANNINVLKVERIR